MSVPPIAPVPPASIRLSLAPEEWTACLDAWLTLAEHTLALPLEKFSPASRSEGSLTRFLRSFYHESARAEQQDRTLRDSKEAAHLKSTCFSLLHRILLETRYGEDLVEWDFLADFCHVHLKNAATPRSMIQIWTERQGSMENVVQQKRDALTKALETSPTQPLADDLRRSAPVLRVSPGMASVFMTGSNFLDALVTSHSRSQDAEYKRTLVLMAYLGLKALAMTETPNISLLTDHLYSLKTYADSERAASSLIGELVSTTPILSQLRRSVIGPASDRLFKLLNTLETYRSPTLTVPKKRIRKPANQGKGKAPLRHDELHVHRMTLVSQLQDLFPDLGEGFLLKLLDEYGDNVEAVTAHLLDDSLPQHLRALDRSEQAPVFNSSEEAKVEQLVPRSTPPPPEPYIPDRRNVFDDDEFDRLEMDTARLHVGKRNKTTSDGQPNKAAILSALAAFDSDDDERDDTYDLEDVGGTVDTAQPDGEPGSSARVTAEENDMALFTAYKASPALFGRTFDVRRGQARQALKAETGMTDEAIEGWAIMLERDPRRLRRLEAQLGSFDGKQAELGRSSYRESPGGTETEDSDVPAGRGGFRGRGRGRGGRGRGGNVAGPSGDQSTAQAQRSKEANKGSRANHNRRDQRAKKMARGGFAG